MSWNPLFAREIGANAAQSFASSDAVAAGVAAEHPQLAKLPHWPNETVAVLCTVDETPYAIPVTAPLRVADRKILLSLKDCRGSLARLRKRPQVALLILDGGNLAFTARGRAFVVQARMTAAPEFVAVAIEADAIDDHRLQGRAIASGPSLDWDSDGMRHLLRAHLEALEQIADDAALRGGLPGFAEALPVTVAK